MQNQSNTGAQGSEESKPGQLKTDKMTQSLLETLPKLLSLYEKATGNSVAMNMMVTFNGEKTEDGTPSSDFCYARNVRLTDADGKDVPTPHIVNAFDVSPSISVYKPSMENPLTAMTALAENNAEFAESNSGEFIVLDGSAQYRKDIEESMTPEDRASAEEISKTLREFAEAKGLLAAATTTSH